jgi:hypothetical protein
MVVNVHLHLVDEYIMSYAKATGLVTTINLRLKYEVLEGPELFLGPLIIENMWVQRIVIL